MKFKKVFIENFRNFEKIEVNISNKNIFFGLNDIGKQISYMRCVTYSIGIQEEMVS